MNELINAAEEERTQETQKKKQKIQEMANIEIQTITKTMDLMEKCEQHMGKVSRYLEVALLALAQTMPSIIPQLPSLLGNNNNCVTSSATQQAATRVDLEQIVGEVVAEGNIYQ
jgi:hypothetical protein